MRRKEQTVRGALLQNRSQTYSKYQMSGIRTVLILDFHKIPKIRTFPLSER